MCIYHLPYDKLKQEEASLHAVFHNLLPNLRTRPCTRGGGGGVGRCEIRNGEMWHSKIVPHFAWYLRTEAKLLPLPDLCTFSLHYKVPRV